MKTLSEENVNYRKDLNKFKNMLEEKSKEKYIISIYIVVMKLIRSSNIQDSKVCQIMN